MLEHMKALLGIELDAVDAIAVTSGPGSFTGLRIGVTTAKALALALNVPVIGVPTLDVIAHNMTHTPHLICPIMDARRNQVYTSLYQWQEEMLTRLTDYKACDVEELILELKKKENQVIFLGDGIGVYQEKIRELLGSQALFAPSFLCLQRASTLLEVAKTRFMNHDVVDAAEFVPMYLRKSQAERERLERERSEH